MAERKQTDAANDTTDELTPVVPADIEDAPSSTGVVDGDADAPDPA
jgi:hypothetical protein